MSRGFRRALSVVAACALLISMTPVSPAGAGVVAQVDESGRTVQPRATTRATPKGISVGIHGLGPRVTSIDVYRSTVSGVQGEKITAAPVKGTEFVDVTAEAGVQYFYTVKPYFAPESGDGIANRFPAGAVAPQVKARVLAVKPTGHGAKERVARTMAAPPKVSLQGRAAPAALVRQVKPTTTIGGSGPVTINTNTTWTTAMSPIYVKDDVIVAAGKTLTIQPGVKVYFDTAASGGAVSPTNPSTLIDLIIHGRLIAKGTSVAPVVMTSILAATTNSDPNDLPDAGDWGYIWQDSRSTSEISRAIVQFGAGIHTMDTARPYISYTTVQNTSDVAIFFHNVVTDANTPAPKIWNCRVWTDHGGIWTEAYNDHAGSTRTNNTYVSDCIVEATYPVYFGTYNGDAAGYNICGGTIKNCTLVADDGGNTVWLQSGSTGSYQSRVNTVISNNVQSAGENAYGAYAEAYADGTGQATCVPSLTGGTVNSYYDAFYAEAVSDGSSSTQTGNAICNPVITSTKLVSTNEDAIDLYSRSDSKGVARTNPSVTSTRIESGGSYGAYLESESEYGAAHAAPVFTDCTGVGSYNSDFIDCYAYTYDAGFANASPVWKGGSIRNLESYGIYVYAFSDKGSAACRPQLSDMSLKSYDYALEGYAYGSQDGGSAPGSAEFWPRIVNCDILSTDYNPVYGYASVDGTGRATSNATVVNSTLEAPDYYGIELYAYSVGGAAVSSPQVRSSYIEGYYPPVYCYAHRSGSGSVSANAVCDPVVTDSTLMARNDDALYCDVTNNGVGQARSSPTVARSDLVSMYDYRALSIDVYNNGSGSAVSEPVVTDSYLKADEGAIAIAVDGPGDVSSSYAKANGSFTNTWLESNWDYAIEISSENDGGTAEARPYFGNCTVTSWQSEGAYIWAAGWGDATERVWCAPTFSGGSAKYTADGFWVFAQSNSGASNEKVLNQAKFVNFPIYSEWDYGVYGYAATSGHGLAQMDVTLQQSNVGGAYGLYLYAVNTNDGRALSTNDVYGASTSRRLRIESSDYYGIYSYASAAGGDAEMRDVYKNLHISSANAGVYAWSHSTGAGKTATNRATVQNNLVDDKWSLYDDAIYLGCWSSAKSVMKPGVTSNRIVRPMYDGIEVNASAGTSYVYSPVIKTNDITLATGNSGIGIYLSTSGVPWPTAADSLPIVERNAILRSHYAGIYIYGPPAASVKMNNVSWSGHLNGSAAALDRCGLYWYHAGTGANVTGNMFRGSEYGTVFEGLVGDPVLRYNSFGDCFGVWQRPFTISTDTATNANVIDARFNWFGSGNSSTIGKTIVAPNYVGAKSDVVKWTNPLPTCQPNVTSIGVTKLATSVRFAVTFDRPMNTYIKTLSFGTSAPYGTYSVTGTWSADGKTFIGTFSPRSALPVGTTMYFSGAKDMPGNAMNSTSRGFRL